MASITEQNYIKRIAAPERQCATLAAQVDRQAKVVDAAIAWRDGHNDGKNLSSYLGEAVHVYEGAMAQLTKDGG